MGIGCGVLLFSFLFFLFCSPLSPWFFYFCLEPIGTQSSFSDSAGQPRARAVNATTPVLDRGDCVSGFVHSDAKC